MVAIGRGEILSASNPKLTFIAQLDGMLVEPTSVDFAIFDRSDPSKSVIPAQVFPNSGTQGVDLVTDKIGTGRYAASGWTVDANADVGRYEVRWTYQLSDSSPVKTARVEFEVVAGAGAIIGPAYALVADLREDGLLDSVDDARAQQAIVIASRMIEQVTGRFFEPRAQDLLVEGKGARALLFDQPIVGVEQILIGTEPSFTPDLVVDSDYYRVFNRHLTQGLTSPDDRNSPKIEFIHQDDLNGVYDWRFQPVSGFSIRSFSFPPGVQNVLVKGVYGYTEPDGTPWGATPVLIRQATKMLARRYLPKMSDECGDDARDGWRIVEERTRDQTVKMADPRKFGSQVIGDPDIDVLLVMFTRPPALGAA